MARKTIAVDDIRKMANSMLANSSDGAKEGRVGITVLLDKILMETGNYHGYNHTDGQQGNLDDTRRVYY